MFIWILLLVLLACSGAISASETALFGLSRQALYEFGRSARPLHREVRALMHHPQRVLMTVLITNTAVNVAIFAVSFMAVNHLREARPALAAIGSVGALVAVVVFGEIVPKTIALSHAKRLAPAAGAFVAILQAVLTPVRWILQVLFVDPLVRLLTPAERVPESVASHELRQLVERSAGEGVIDSQEHEMLQGVVTAALARVSEVMTPRVDIRSVRVGASRKATLQAIRASGGRKIAVHGRDLDDVRGVLYARDVVLNPGKPIRSLLKPVHFVPEQANLVQLLYHFRIENIQFAMVVDEYGGTAGCVSADDVIEWIAGDVPDERDQQSALLTEKLGDDCYRVSGNLSARLWAERFAVRQADRHIDTVGGLVVAKLGRVPRAGDSVRIRNLDLTVESVSKRRIERILVRRIAAETPNEEHRA